MNVINYPFPNINSVDIEVWEGISNSSQTLLGMWVIIHTGI